jgi:superfamily I DNA/RNA helicase
VAGAARPEELEGETRRVSDLGALNLRSGETWMLLVRNWTFVADLVSELEAAGIPYRVGGENYYSPWSEKGPLRAAKALFALSTPGQQIGTGELEALLEKTRAQTTSLPGAWAYGRKSKVASLIEEQPGTRVGLLDLPHLGLTEWGFDRIALRDLDVLSGVSQRDRDAYAASLRVGTWGEEPKVLISTIHGVKGGEADRVCVLESCTQAPLRNLDRADRRAEEIRLAYVAITRARLGFYVLEHQGGYGYPFDVFSI